MKIMQCPNCQEAVVTNISGKELQKVITCVHCGFSDYAYIFKLPQTQYFSNHTPKELAVADVIQIVSQQLKETDLSHINISQFIFDLHNRCKEFSPLVICKLINTLLEHSEITPTTTENDTLFVKYEPEKISLDEIYQKLNEFQTTFLLKMQLQGDISIEPSDTDIQLLKKELRLRQHDIDSWIKEYDLLLEKYNKALEEIETLKFILKK